MTRFDWFMTISILCAYACIASFGLHMTLGGA